MPKKVIQLAAVLLLLTGCETSSPQRPKEIKNDPIIIERDINPTGENKQKSQIQETRLGELMDEINIAILSPETPIGAASVGGDHYYRKYGELPETLENLKEGVEASGNDPSILDKIRAIQFTKTSEEEVEIEIIIDDRTRGLIKIVRSGNNE